VYKASDPPLASEPLLTGIEIHGLTKTYRGGRVRALDDVSLAVRPGEAFGIIGPNGAGKTTLLGCLLGFLRPDAGRMTVDGRPPDDLAVRRVTGYLPERLVLDRWMTGLDFLRYHHALAGLDPARRSEAAAESLSRVGLEPAAGGQTIRRYSRGMLQRLGLAQAMLGSPRYLYLDEPISGVDPAGVMLFRRLLGELRARGATLIVNSHQLDEVERICDRVAFVRNGQVQSIETPSAGAALARVLAVRWAASSGAEAVSADRLGALAAGASATLLEVKPPAARFSVADDDAAARLLQALLEAGVRVIEAAPEGGRLERLFAEPEAATPPAAPGRPPAAPPGGAAP
jgi:ABC-2 type transport system ATP-binding protein